MQDADSVVDAARAALHARGERMTSPRRAVLLAVAAGGHVTAEEVAARVAASDPTVHRSSVYRSLDAFGGLGIVAHVHVGHGPTVYHVAAPPLVRAQCRRCGVIVAVDAAALAGAASALAEQHGFALSPDHVALSGTCSACQQAPVEAPGQGEPVGGEQALVGEEFARGAVGHDPAR